MLIIHGDPVVGIGRVHRHLGSEHFTAFHEVVKVPIVGVAKSLHFIVQKHNLYSDR